MPSITQPSCHTETTIADVAVGQPTVALVGPPNAGKSTLFNSLTNLRRTVGNWPGTSVEVGRGVASLDNDESVLILDLPGAYSLDPQSPDEALTHELLTKPSDELPNAIVIVVDSTKLSQGLYLVSQLRDMHVPIVIALTMVDVAKRRGVEIDAKILADTTGIPVVPLDPRRVRGIDSLRAAIHNAVQTSEHHRSPSCGVEFNVDNTHGIDNSDGIDNTHDIDAILAATDRRFAWVESVLTKSTSYSPARATVTDYMDRALTARFFGPIAFLFIMWCVFQATTTIAAPMQDALDSFFSGPVSDGANWLLRQVGLDDTWVNGLVIDGVIAGVGMLLTFLPLMAVLFLLLSLLEDSGYMARAAVVANRAMRAIGLPGKAFLPLIVGFGCNVPAISATRVLGDARHRLLTALLIPFTSCSARLTVYLFIAATFFPKNAGTVVFAMYVISIVLVVATGFVLRSFLWRTLGSTPLLIELPPYQRPHLRVLLQNAAIRVKGFLRTATGIILLTVFAVWLLQATPLPGKSGSFAAVDSENSVFAGVARVITPAFAPTGFDDWRTTSALVVGFVAKEAVLSSWAQTYAIEDDTKPGAGQELGERVQSDFRASSGGHERAAVWAFLIFLLGYTPCVATLAAQRQEIGLRWTIFGVAMQLAIAWILAVAVFQIGSNLL